MNNPIDNIQLPTNPDKAPQSRRKLIIIGAAIIILALLILGTVLVVKKSQDPKTVSVSKALTKTPAKVGSYRYVNACQVVPLQSYKDVFGYEATNDNTISNDFSEGNRSKLAVITSECSSEFGNVKADIGGGKTSDSSVGTINLRLYQYTNTERPKSDVDFYDRQKGQDVSLGALGKDETIKAGNFETLSIDGINVYNNLDTVGRFYFAYRNMSASAAIEDLDNPNGSAESFTQPDYVKQVIAKYVPAIKKSIDNAQLPQEPLAVNGLGDRVKGANSAKILAACDNFTSEDFKAITGIYDDSMRVELDNQSNPKAYAAGFDTTKKATGGIGRTECTRNGFINVVQPDQTTIPDLKEFAVADGKYKQIEFPVVSETISYYDKPSDAVDGVKFHESANKQNYPDTVNTVVSGVGDYAALSEYTFASNLTDSDNSSDGPKEMHLYVAKGAYVVDIEVFYSSGNTNVTRRGTLEQFKKAAQLIANRLPN